jgi:hypothetical protein
MPDKTFTAQLSELEQAARAEQHELERQREQAQRRTRELRAQLAARPVDEFDAGGVSKPKSEARRLQNEIDSFDDALFAERIKSAEQRTRAAWRTADRFINSHLVEIAHERQADDVQCVADFAAWLDEGERIIRTIFDRAGSWGPLLKAVPGLDIQR